jgi:hypothetical protein
MEVDAFNNATILIKSDKDLTLTVYQGFMTSAGTVSYIYEDTTAVTGGTGTGQLISLYGPYLMIEAENADIAGAVVNACIVLRSIA